MRENPPYLIRRTDPGIPGVADDVVIQGSVLQESVHFWVYWRLIRRYSRLIITLFLCAVLLTALIVFTMTPTFTAVSTILIERQAPQAIDVKDLAVEESHVPMDDYDYYKTQ